MSFTQRKFPLGISIIGLFFISLFFLEIILVTTMFPDMPGQFWLIGISSFIIGALILTYAFLKSRTGEPEQRAISGEEDFVTDEEMRRIFRISIAMFLGNILLWYWN